MKALTQILALVALIPAALIAAWALGWRHWTAWVAAVFVAAFIVVAVLRQPRAGSAARGAEEDTQARDTKTAAAA